MITGRLKFVVQKAGEMKIFLLFFFASILSVSQALAQEKTIHLRYNENAQKLVVNEQGYMVLSYDMYLLPADGRGTIGPCHLEYGKENPERLQSFYDRIRPGDKVQMTNIRVLNFATKKAEKVADYYITLK